MIYIIFLVLCFLMPSMIYANSITSLIFVNLFYLLIGNILISIFESWFIIKFFKLKKSKKILLIIILANYTSMLLGDLIISIIRSMMIIDIYNIKQIILYFTITLFILTLILELPFYIFIFKKGKNTLKKGIKALILANTISYIIIISIYLLTIDISLINHYNAVDLKNMNFKHHYYIEYDKVNIKRYKTSSIENIKLINSKKNKRIKDNLGTINSLLKSKNKWDLVNYSYAIYSGSFPITQQIPKLSSRFSYATYIGDDKILFQLDEYQIIVLDLKTSKMALVTYGKNPKIYFKTK